MNLNILRQTGASMQGCLQSALPSFFLQHWPPRSLLDTSDTSAHSLLSSPFFWFLYLVPGCVPSSARGKSFSWELFCHWPAINQLFGGRLLSQQTLAEGLLSIYCWPTGCVGARCSPSACLGSVSAKGTHTWNRINNLHLSVFVSNAGSGLCWVTVLLWGNCMWGKPEDKSLPSTGEGAIKIPQGEKQTKRPGGGDY